MNIVELDGRRFASWLADENSESAMFSGETRWDGSTLLLIRDPKPAFEIRPEWYKRIQVVSNDEVRKILLGADYFARLNVGEGPERAKADEFEQTGLKWPE